MLYLPLSKFSDSSETIVAPGATIADEGACLIRAAGATASGVTASGGNASELFVGFSFAGVSAAPFVPANGSKVESFTVPSSGNVSLAFTPVSGQILIYDNTTAAVVAISGGVSLTANVIAGLTPGDSVTVTYRYALTVLQARALQGDIQPGGYAGAYVGQIGLIKRGIIYTDLFDASKNWLTPGITGITTGAGGLVTQGGSGTVINGYVVNVPNVNVPFLGLEFSAA